LFVYQLLFKMSEYFELLTRYQPVAAGLGDQKLLGVFYQRLAACEWWFGRLDESIETYTKACNLLKDASEEKEEDLALAYMGLEWSHLWKGDFFRVDALKEIALRSIAKALFPRCYVLTLGGASWAHSHMGRWDQAIEEAQEGLRTAEEDTNNSLISFSLFVMSVAYSQKGDLGRALECGEKGVQHAPTPADQVWAQTGLAWAHGRLGDPAKGIELAENLASMYQAVRFLPAEIYLIILAGEGYFRCGDSEAAAKKLREGLERAEQAGMRFLIGYAHRLLGETVLEVNPEEAADHFTKAMAVFEEIGAENELALACAGLGRLHAKQGDIAQGREYLTRALEIFERLGTLLEPDRVRKELDSLPP